MTATQLIRNSLPSVEIKGSQVFTQVPVTGPYPQPDEFSLCHNMLFLFKIHFNVILLIPRSPNTSVPFKLAK
jgi:hypothetical protein